MKHNYKRLLAAALTLVMVLALLPIVALADGPFNDLAAAEGDTIVSQQSIDGVSDDPTVATTFTVTSSTIITGIHTYHWASGGTDHYQSATFTLTHSDGTTYGPWSVSAATGGTKTNTNWFAFPNEIIKPGTYTLVNSKNDTWSHNTDTGNKGMCDIKGVAVGNISSGTVSIIVTGTVTAEATFSGITTTGTLKLDKGPLTITGTGTNGITVTGNAENPNAVVPILFDNVTSTAVSPLLLATGAKVDLTLKGTNALSTLYTNCSAICVPSGCALTIGGDGSLEASSTEYEAAIGSTKSQPAGTITINSGSIKAWSGRYGPGIGSGNYNTVGTVIINGGTVMAYSAMYMGETFGIKSGSVTINGGNVLSQKSPGSPNACSPAPPYGADSSRYPITITLGSCSQVVSVTAGSIGGVACSTIAAPTAGYGIEGMKTFPDGKLILWLPAQTDTAVSITAGGAVYTGTITVSGTGINTATLTAAAISSLSASPATLGSSGGDATITVSGSDLPAGIQVKAFDGATATAISGTTTGSGNTGTVTLTFPQNSGSTDKVYTIKAASPGGGASWDDETCTVTVQKQGSNMPPFTDEVPATTTVTQPEDGAVTISPLKPARGDSVTVSVTPDEGFTIGSITVKDKNGRDISVIANADGSFSFTHPGDEVTIEAELVPLAGFEQEGRQNSFTDVSDDAWYFDAVQYVSENGVMNGTGDNDFSPDISLSRAMLVQILYNLEGRPDAGSNTFGDVNDDAWYADAVAWAASSGIVSGMGDGFFAPDGDITREQMAVMLYNYCKYRGITLPETADAEITDADAVGDWALEAVQAMYRAGILSGKGGGVFDPSGTATRAEVAQMIMSFMEAIK